MVLFITIPVEGIIIIIRAGPKSTATQRFGFHQGVFNIVVVVIIRQSVVFLQMHCAVVSARETVGAGGRKEAGEVPAAFFGVAGSGESSGC